MEIGVPKVVLIFWHANSSFKLACQKIGTKFGIKIYTKKKIYNNHANLN